MNTLEELWSRFVSDGVSSLTTDELENLLFMQHARILKLERESATAVKMTGVTAGNINISGVNVTKR